MNTVQLANIRDLRNQGLSIRDIADETGLSKSAVDRALKDDTIPIGKSPGNDTTAEPTAKLTEKRPTPATSGNVELGKLDLELSHERFLAKIKIEQESMALQRRQLEIEAERIEHERKVLANREKTIEWQQQAEEDKLAQQKEMLMDRHNRLVRELLKNCQDSSWSEPETDEYIDRVKKTQKKVTRFCDEQAINEDGLAIHRNLSSLLKLVETTKEEESGFFSSDITFDFDKVQVKEVKGWLIEDFEDMYVKPVKKKPVDEEEDEEDDSDDEKELTNSEWMALQYLDYIERILLFSEELIAYLDTLDESVDTDTLAIAVHTENLLEYVTERTAVVKEDEEKLTVFANVNDRAWLESLLLEDFHEEIEDNE